jgi:hypothetical protein
MDGRREVWPIPGLDVGDDEYQFCKNFVIETALYLAAMDFDLDLYRVMEHHFAQEAGANWQQGATSATKLFCLVGATGFNLWPLACKANRGKDRIPALEVSSYS